MEENIFIFKNKELDIDLVVKGNTRFMACCYANQFLEQKKIDFRFDTTDGLECLVKDVDFGIIHSDIGGKYERFTNDFPFFKSNS